jgi:undecaprenyl-diphosphatase
MYRSPLLTLDQDVLNLQLRWHYPQWAHPVATYVMLGQRAPATLVALPWFLWRCWMSRSARPLVMLGTALLVLNLTVGGVKEATGRLGPLATHQVHAVFDGGNIFPSGHVSNAVVLYGVIAMLAVTYRRTVIAAAIIIPLTVGLGTIYLDTHWFTDVLGGWFAGALVLMVLPWVMPYSERAVASLGRLMHRAGRALERHPAGRVLPAPVAHRLAPRRPVDITHTVRTARATVPPLGHRALSSAVADAGQRLGFAP